MALAIVPGLPARGLAGQTQDLDVLRRQIEALQRVETQQRQVSDQADAMRRRQDEMLRPDAAADEVGREAGGTK